MISNLRLNNDGNINYLHEESSNTNITPKEES